MAIGRRQEVSLVVDPPAVDIDASIEQVAGILHRGDLKFETRPDGKAYRLLFVGGEAVFVDFGRWHDDSVMISVTSRALQEIAADSIGAAVVLNRLNELNNDNRFLKFVFVDEMLVVAHDLLGDTLQAGELLHAVYGVANAARRVAEDLQPEVGGKRHCEMERSCDEDEDEQAHSDFDFDFDDLDLGED